MAIAFFDLDKTLLSVNSASLFVRYELHHKHLKLSQALRAMGWLIRYRLGDADLDAAIRFSIATLRGQPERVLAERTAHFYRTEVRHRYRPGGLAALAEHRRRGDKVVLLSSTTSYLAEEVRRDIAFDEVLCTRLEIDEHAHFTGRPVEPLCYGVGKLTWAQRAADAFGAKLADCTFYSDSNADVPVFAAVGRPVAINPDPVLRRLARSKQWPCLDWGRPPRQKRAATVAAQRTLDTLASIGTEATPEKATPNA